MSDARLLIRQFIDRCQTTIGEPSSRPNQLKALATAARRLARATRSFSFLEQTLARTMMLRALLPLIDRHGLSADGEINAALVAVAARDELDPACRHLFKTWSAAMASSSGRSSPEDSRVRAALDAIARSYRDPKLSLRRIAAEVAVSPWHLTRLLRAQTGLTYIQHVQHTRVRAAGQLLVTTSMPVKQIAWEVGYGNRRDLERHFRDTHSLSPAKFRRALRS